MKDSSKQGRNRSREEGAEKGAVKTTIVGGRPPGHARWRGSIPHRIEVLV